MEQEQTLYTLYKHRCKANNKVYIGLTNKSANDRWKDGKGYKSNFELYKDIREYGWEDGFEHEIIRDDMSYEEAKDAEINLIKIYDATNPERGYNNHFGGSYGAFRRPSEIGAKIKNYLEIHVDHHVGQHHRVAGGLLRRGVLRPGGCLAAGGDCCHRGGILDSLLLRFEAGGQRWRLQVQKLRGRNRTHLFSGAECDAQGHDALP